MQDYTENGDIIRGSEWPPGGNALLSVEITRDGGWPAGANTWTWTMRLSRTRRGGTPDLEIEAESVSLVGDVLTASFRATALQTAGLPAGKGRFNVGVWSDDGAGGESSYPCVAGTANVSDGEGEG